MHVCVKQQKENNLFCKVRLTNEMSPWQLGPVTAKGWGFASGLVLRSGQMDVCTEQRRGHCWRGDVINLTVSLLSYNCEYPSPGAIFKYYYFINHPLLNNFALLYLPSLMCGDFVQSQHENKKTSIEMPPPGNYQSVSAAAFPKAAVLLVNSF